MKKMNWTSKLSLTILILLLWLSFFVICLFLPASIFSLLIDGTYYIINDFAGVFSFFLVICAAIAINSLAFWGIMKILKKHYDDRSEVKFYSYFLIALFAATTFWVSFLPKDVTSFIICITLLTLILCIYVYNVKKYFGPSKISIGRDMKGFYPYLINGKNVKLKILDANGKEKDYDNKLQKGDTIKVYRNNKNILELEIKDI